jgi:predicted nicotinamide N-methyase
MPPMALRKHENQLPFLVKEAEREVGGKSCYCTRANRKAWGGGIRLAKATLCHPLTLPSHFLIREERPKLRIPQ